MIKGESTVSAKGRLVIPREIRQALDVQRGDKLAWVMGDDGTLQVTVAKGDLMALKGRIKSAGRSVSIEEMDEAVGDSASFTQVADGYSAMHAAHREDEVESGSGVSNSTRHNWDAWFDGGGTSEDFSPR